ncbi:MAG: site-2 protease family protein [Myxococcales bacterium]|nr:site-2 protease family protein [Myxococcales bacterium]
MRYLVVIVALSVLVFIHELGHYLVARAFGMRVKVFSIGFGPVIARWRPKGSETLFQLAAIPVLAYVQIAGMSPSEAVDPHDRGSYQNASALGRLFTIAAGPLANYLAASLIIFGVLFFGGVNRPVIGQIEPGSPAAVAGLRPNDVVLRVGDTAPSNFSELIDAVQSSAGRPLAVRVRRGNEIVEARPAARMDAERHQWRLGIRGSAAEANEPVPLRLIVRQTLVAPARLTVEQVKAIGRMLRGRERPQMMGPVRIVYETAQVAQHSVRHALDVFAIISLALFFFNLLPVPALDGGRMIFLGYEMLLRRKPSARFEERATTVSMMALLALSAVIFVNDIFNIVRH